MSDFIYQEERYVSSTGVIIEGRPSPFVVIRRKVVAGPCPANWREFFGTGEVELPVSATQSTRNEIVFPFIGISTSTKSVMKCVQECMKIYAEVLVKAQQDTLAEYKEHVRKHLAAQAEAKAAAAAKGPATEGERHVDAEGNPAAPPAKRSVILGPNG